MIRALLTQIRQSDRVLYRTGCLMLVLLFLFFCIAPWDDRLVTGVNPWLKPMKFAGSIAIYLWTVALFVGYLPGPRWAILTIRWGTALALITEIVLIGMQAARGVASHFNVSTPFDAQVFGMMGLAILVNTLLAFLLFVQTLWQEIKHPRAYVMGIRLGLIVFILGSFQGGLLLMNQGHTVGAADGGPGLPLLNWSTTHGDLRVSHAIGLHGLQLIPLIGYLVSRWCGRKPLVLQFGLVTGVALVWVATFVVTFHQATAGRPLIAVP